MTTETITKACKRCGKEFSCQTKRQKSKLFCSAHCALLWRNEMDNPSKTESARQKIGEALHERMAGKPKTMAHREAMSRGKCGANHWNWKGGVSGVRKLAAAKLDFRLWRRTVLSRDGHACALCQRTDAKLHVHHILPFARFRSSAITPANGITLCAKCHVRLHRWMARRAESPEAKDSASYWIHGWIEFRSRATAQVR